jgi:hypothetical protein
MTSSDVYQRAFEAARLAYLAEHPEPTETDFVCPRCFAQLGEPCRWGYRRRDGREFHLARQDRYSRALADRRSAANDAGWAAEEQLIKKGARP